jgi:hypothetical protein
MCGNKKALFVSFDDQPVYCSFPKANGATLYTYTLRLEDSDLGPGADRSHLTEGHFYLLIGSRDSQLNHFTRELVDFCLFSVWHSRGHYWENPKKVLRQPPHPLLQSRKPAGSCITGTEKGYGPTPNPPPAVLKGPAGSCINRD